MTVRGVSRNTTTTAPSSPIREEQRSWKLVTNQSTAIATWGQHWRCKGSEPSVGATCSKHRNRPQRPNILPDLQAVASGDVIESNGVEKKKKISCPDRIMQMRWVQGIEFFFSQLTRGDVNHGRPLASLWSLNNSPNLIFLEKKLCKWVGSSLAVQM